MNWKIKKNTYRSMGLLIQFSQVANASKKMMPNFISNPTKLISIK